MKLPEPPHLRELDKGNEQEMNLVLSGWLRTFVGTPEKPSSVDLTIERGVMFKLYHPLVQDIIARSTVVVACMPEAKDIIYGWVCFDGDVLHYVCTKPKWQRLGIASYLLADMREHKITYTHRTSDGMRLPLPESWEYRPMARFSEAA